MFGLKLLSYNHGSFEQALRSLFLAVTVNVGGDVRLRQVPGTMNQNSYPSEKQYDQNKG